MDDDILVEVTRGGRVKSRHRGAVAVVDADGAVAFQVGDIGSPVFPRSAVKAFQVLPLVESGAADRFGLVPAEIALTCASHSGEPTHVDAAASVLGKAGRGGSHLGCGSYWPSGADATQALAAAGQRPTALHGMPEGIGRPAN